MSKLASELEITNNLSSVTLPTYSSTTLTLGTLMRYVTGATNADNYVGPFSIALARPNETSTAVPIAHLSVIDYSPSTQWVIGSDNATAAATRRFTFFEYNKINSLYTWKGFITVNYGGITTNHTMRGHRAVYNIYTAGTVFYSGTSVTGVSTVWTGSSLASGSRIGFGASDPNQIGAWYMITGITNNTAITLASFSVPPTVQTDSSVPYVIEDFRIAYVTTNATAANGGLFLVKGLRYEDFTTAGSTIITATTDHQKAVYYLPDSPVLTNNAAAGIAIEDFNTWNLQSIYVLDTNNRVYKYNIRASLGTGTSFNTPSGRTVGTLLLSTGTQAITGTLSQNNNGRIANLSHGPGAGIPSLYFVTTTRIYRSALTAITNNSVTWQSDLMTENPPGTTSTFTLTGTLNGLEVLSNIDRFAIFSTHASATKSYITRYRTDGGQMDHIFLADAKQIDQTSVNSDTTPFPSTLSTTFAGWSEEGYFHMIRQGTTSLLSHLYCVPICADWTYAATSNQRVIFPKIATTGAIKFYRAYVSSDYYVGGAILGQTVEPLRIYARTSGIDDNSGSWTLLDDHLDLTGFAASDYIQLMAEFRTIGITCVPNKIHSVSVIYEDNSTDSHYQPSVANSDIANKRFAWRLSGSWGSTVPTLRVRLYDAVSGGILVDDNTASPNGTFEKSTDGGSNWTTYDTSDKTNETTYIRYTPASLGDNIKVRALLTQN